MKRRGFTLLELVIVLGILLGLASILFPIFGRTHGCGGHRPSCQSNLKQMGLAFMQYAQDYDEQLPPTRVKTVSTSVAPYRTPYGWADTIQLYLKSTQVYQCRTEGNPGNQNADAVLPNFTDYWYNTNLSTLKQDKIKYMPNTIMAGEGNDGTDLTNSRYNRNILPLTWLNNSKSPARRHLDTANYLFADGHVKAMRPEQIMNQGAAKTYSFAVE